jgi:hypothetical protein
MKRLLGCLAALVLLVSIAPLAIGQEQPAVVLTLVRQTPWNSPKSPQVDLTFKAENTSSQTLGNLSVVITVFQHVTSRSQYELSLTEDPTLPIPPTTRKPLPGTLAPGAARIFSISKKLALPQLDSQVYPLKIDFGSGIRSLGTLRTSVIYLVEKPQTPLSLGWTFVLDAPVLFEPGGVFRNATLERQLAPGGRIAAEIAALRSITPASAPSHVDVVISPSLVTQLVRMKDGYTVRDGSTLRHVPAGQGGAADAQQALEDLGHIASKDQIELSAMPFSEPLVPSLLASGLARDLGTQLERGRSELQQRLHAAADPSVFRPPDAAIDGPSVQQLARQGVDLMLLDAGTLQGRSSPLGFAAPPAAKIPLGPSKSLTAIVPESGVQSLLGSSEVQDDPVLGAHAVLGDLAEIWLESPSKAHATALRLSEHLTLPSSFFGPFARGVVSAPWLEPLKGEKLVQTFGPSDTLSHLSTWRGPNFSGSYVQSLKRARKRIHAYESVLVGKSPLPAQLDTSLLIAEAGAFTGEERLGRPFIEHVQAAINAEFSQVRPDVSQPVTLTSANSVSSIPIHIVNGSQEPIKVTVQLVSPRLLFANGNSQTRALTQPDETLSFGVTPQTTGRFPVQVLVRTPSGRVLSSATLIVRSTAYNRIALIITIGAALMLLAIYARRAVLARRSSGGAS